MARTNRPRAQDQEAGAPHDPTPRAHEAAATPTALGAALAPVSDAAGASGRVAGDLAPAAPVAPRKKWQRRHPGERWDIRAPLLWNRRMHFSWGDAAVGDPVTKDQIKLIGTGRIHRWWFANIVRRADVVKGRVRRGVVSPAPS